MNNYQMPPEKPFDADAVADAFIGAIKLKSACITCNSDPRIQAVAIALRKKGASYQTIALYFRGSGIKISKYAVRAHFDGHVKEQEKAIV